MLQYFAFFAVRSDKLPFFSCFPLRFPLALHKPALCHVCLFILSFFDTRRIARPNKDEKNEKRKHEEVLQCTVTLSTRFVLPRSLNISNMMCEIAQTLTLIQYNSFVAWFHLPYNSSRLSSPKVAALWGTFLFLFSIRPPTIYASVLLNNFFIQMVLSIQS